MKPLSPLRSILLRGCFLLLLAGLGLTIGPAILTQSASAPLMDGVVNALLGALALFSLLGLWVPMKMLPILVFEVVWKSIWTLSVALPRWLDGTLDASTIETLFACALAIPFLFIIPWQRFWHDLRGPTPPRARSCRYLEN